MQKLGSKKEIGIFTLILTLTYMVSYITRINYGAIISEMVVATSFSKSLISMAVTGSFITYGVGQIISGIIGDRVSPKKLVFYGLIVTVLMNLLIPICQNPYQMVFVWCINGLAQSFMWPPLVRLMTALLNPEDYKNTTSKVILGSSIGTIIVYLVSPILIYLFNWKAVFLFAAFCGIIMIFVWNKFAYEIQPQIKDKTQNIAKNPKSNIAILVTPLIITIMLAIISQGMLRDGITTWMPSYISETYNLSSEISILTGVLLPIFSMLCLQFATKLYIKVFTNPLMCAGVFFGVGALSALGLCMLTGRSVLFSIVFSSVLTGCMHGVNLMLICMLPPFFEKYGNVATVSGVLNACTYIGSAVSTYGIAYLSENKGWGFTLLVWLFVALFGTLICLLCVKPWKRKFEN